MQDKPTAGEKWKANRKRKTESEERRKTRHFSPSEKLLAHQVKWQAETEMPQSRKAKARPRLQHPTPSLTERAAAAAAAAASTLLLHWLFARLWVVVCCPDAGPISRLSPSSVSGNDDGSASASGSGSGSGSNNNASTVTQQQRNQHPDRHHDQYETGTGTGQQWQHVARPATCSSRAWH